MFDRAGVWFWSAIVLGGVLRLYLVLFTEGTYDVAIWQRHSTDVQERGLIGAYYADPSANHPPFISEAGALLLRAAQASGIPFRILLRLPMALLDGGTLLLLLALFEASRWRFIAAVCYWLNPLAIIFSSYHGNTDSAVAFFLLLSVWLLSRAKTIAGAIALGSIFWIKLPGVLAIPALFFFVKSWKQRLLFLFVAGITALSTYLPAFFQDAKIVYANVLGYHGLYLQSPGRVPVWGPVRVLLFSIIAPPERWPESARGPILFLMIHGWAITLGLVLLLTWLRRSCRSTAEVCATIAMAYTMVYGLSETLAFQYFAWSLPFWFFLRPWFTISASVLAGGYIYSLYWLLCGNPWLLGKWDFAAHPFWPMVVILFRDAACIFFFVSAIWFVASAAWAEIKKLTVPAAFPSRP